MPRFAERSEAAADHLIALLNQGFIHRWRCGECKRAEVGGPRGDTPDCPNCGIAMIPCVGGAELWYRCGDCEAFTYRLWRRDSPTEIECCKCGGKAACDAEHVKASVYQCGSCGRTVIMRAGHGRQICCVCKGELNEQ